MLAVPSDRPQRPKSTWATAPCSSARRRNDATSVTGGTALGITSSVVMPPTAAARLACAKSSLCVSPGSRGWMWGSMNPGNTSRPVASTILVGAGLGAGIEHRRDLPSSHSTSAARQPSDDTTVPPRTSRLTPVLPAPGTTRRARARRAAPALQTRPGSDARGPCPAPRTPPRARPRRAAPRAACRRRPRSPRSRCPPRGRSCRPSGYRRCRPAGAPRRRCRGCRCTPCGTWRCTTGRRLSAASAAFCESVGLQEM